MIRGQRRAQKGAAALEKASVIRRPERISLAPARSTRSRRLTATIVQRAREVEPGALEALGHVPLLVGFLVSAIVGTIALKLVLVLLYRAQLKVFAIYLFLLAGLVALGFLDGLL